jgi:hypothetical protein
LWAGNATLEQWDEIAKNEQDVNGFFFALVNEKDEVLKTITFERKNPVRDDRDYYDM